MNGLPFLLALPLLAAAQDTVLDPHYISCVEFPDGYHEVGCWGKATCVNGQPQVTLCNQNEMFDFATDSCISRSSVTDTTDCNTAVDCTQETTGRHADVRDRCRSYHSCMGGAFVARYYCPPGTVFNEALQVCDYAQHAPPPCGSYTGTFSSTPSGPWPEFPVAG